MEHIFEPTEQERQEGQDYYEAASALPTLADKADLFKQSVKDQILNGYLNPLEFYRQAKIVGECIEELKKDPEIYDCAYTEREKYGKEKPKVNGAVIDNGSRTTYNYKSCNDPEYNRLEKELEDRKAFLKALKEPLTVVDTASGETVTIQPPTLTISNFITVKI